MAWKYLRACWIKEKIELVFIHPTEWEKNQEMYYLASIMEVIEHIKRNKLFIKEPFLVWTGAFCWHYLSEGGKGEYISISTKEADYYYEQVQIEHEKRKKHLHFSIKDVYYDISFIKESKQFKLDGYVQFENQLSLENNPIPFLSLCVCGGEISEEIWHIPHTITDSTFFKKYMSFYYVKPVLDSYIRLFTDLEKVGIPCTFKDISYTSNIRGKQPILHHYTTCFINGQKDNTFLIHVHQQQIQKITYGNHELCCGFYFDKEFQSRFLTESKHRLRFLL